MRQILLLTFIVISFSVGGQTRTITGKVIDEYFENLSGVQIQNSDTIQFGMTDANGEFKIEIPTNTDSLLFGFIGMEWATIKLTSNCDRLEIIMILSGTYHYRSHKKIDRIRKDLFDKIPDLHSNAFDKGFFTSPTPCYKRVFKPDKPQLDEIRKELKIEGKRIKTLFNKLEIGDTIQVPFSGTYRSDGTDRTTLTPWAYFTDVTKSQCIIEGIITNKDKRNSGYNIEIKITDYKSCKYDTPIIYQEKDIAIGTVFRHNMRILKVLTK